VATLQDRVEQDQAIRTGITASAIAHLSILALLVLMSEVHPFGSVTEPIAVDIVTPKEIEPEQPRPAEPKQAEQIPQPPDPSRFTQPASPSPQAPPPAGQAASAPPQPATAQPATAQAARATAPAPPAQLGSATPGYRPPEPDLSVKYNVVLGLPVEPLPPPMANPGKSDDGFDATASSAADISSNVIAEFRRHLKTCSKLPSSISPSDHIMVKLRVLMTQDGRLAAEPAIGGGSANMKAIELLQNAIAALKQCQPYTMLPAERYGEWKVLDLDFTPKDFSG
jgi:hypothetical protein